MFEAARRHMRSIAAIGVASALTVGGVAVAQGGGEGDVEPANHPMHVSSAIGGGMSSLTYAELRARPGDEDQTIRVKPGGVESAADPAILPRNGDVVRAARPGEMPPPAAGPTRLEMAPAR